MCDVVACKEKTKMEDCEMLLQNVCEQIVNWE